MTGERLVAVVGAGPAGLFAARRLAENGATVVLLNRDVKPGGLAEYGIFPDKHKMKEGLRKQFRGILGNRLVHYYGNVPVGKGQGAVPLGPLLDRGAQAVLVTSGAQGTKWPGIPGETLRRVVHAKQYVYHFNRLPPFATREFDLGRRVAIVGMGNVMVDVAHWLLQYERVEEVVVLARRGPAERKYDAREIPDIIAYLEPEELRNEIRRIGPTLRAAGQDPEAELAALLEPMARARAREREGSGRLRFRFFSAPAGVQDDGAGGVGAIRVEERVVDRAAGHSTLPFDSVVFAIGDQVDEELGLAAAGGAFTTSEAPRFPVEGESYEAIGMDGVFVGGWSRRPSSGLVGEARRDGTQAAVAVLHYLEGRPVLDEAEMGRRLAALHELAERPHRPVADKAACQRLEESERAEAAARGLPVFRYPTNEAMFRAIAERG